MVSSILVFISCHRVTDTGQLQAGYCLPAVGDSEFCPGASVDITNGCLLEMVITTVCILNFCSV